MHQDAARAALMMLNNELDRLARTLDTSAWPSASGDLDARAEAAALARLRAAEAAVALAAALLEQDDAPAAGELRIQVNRLAHKVRDWRKVGRGWFEERTITRTARRGSTAGDTVTYGPYYYFRWRDSSGRRQSQYLGKERPAEMDRPPARGALIIDQE